MFKGLKKEKCIGKGVTEGGNHGKTFMPEYLAFWRENLLNWTSLINSIFQMIK